MFEFHGWAVIRVPWADEEPAQVLSHREDSAVKRVRSAIKECGDNRSIFEIRRSGNGQIVLYAHGLRNHRREEVIELFRWVARELPNSYGLLYVHDDESPEHENEFRVWRLARGVFEELPDPFLSPYIPTVETPCAD